MQKCSQTPPEQRPLYWREKNATINAPCGLVGLIVHLTDSIKNEVTVVLSSCYHLHVFCGLSFQFTAVVSWLLMEVLDACLRHPMLVYVIAASHMLYWRFISRSSVVFPSDKLQMHVPRALKRLR